MEVKRTEKRGCNREDINARCWVHDTLTERFAKMVNLSKTGARIATTLPPRKGEHLIMFFRETTRGQVIRRAARVVWSGCGPQGRGGMMGVAFDDQINASVH